MGMFDSIRFEDTTILPKPEGFDLDLEKLDFQTKSLDNCLYLFEISKDKYLYREDGPFREDSEKPGRRCRVDFHGIINFGAYHQTDLLDYSIGYEAKFTDGVLQDIQLIEYKVIPHESLKAKRERLMDSIKKDNNRIVNKMIKLLQNTLVIYPLRLLGFKFHSNIFGVFRSNKYMVCFHAPKIIFGYKKQIRGFSCGISIDKTTTEILYTKNLSNKDFSFKILGFGFTVTRFEEILWD